MDEKKERLERERDVPPREPQRRPPETAEEPVPGVEHQPEPDAENIIPAEDKPGTF